jgi:gas vesicle protein
MSQPTAANAWSAAASKRFADLARHVRRNRTMYREEQSGASFVLGMMTGAFIGAGVALLFAPKSGQETRQQLGEQYRGLAERVGETTQTLRDRAQTLKEQGRERVEQLTSQLSDRVSSGQPRATGYEAPSSDRFPSSVPSV